MGALLGLLTQLRPPAPPKKTKEQRIDELLDGLKRRASRQVVELVGVANGAMNDLGRVMSILPADDREDVVEQIVNWALDLQAHLPAMREKDIAEGIPTSSLPPELQAERLRKKAEAKGQSTTPAATPG
jgi:hypothetical protein